jgi:hypothetical protein
MAKKSIWTECWKCEGDIYSQADCFYVKCRDGNYSFCPPCYGQFLENNKDYFRPDINRKDELYRSFNMALSEFHDKMVEEGIPIRRGMDNRTTFLIHKGEFWGRGCEACEEMRTLIVKEDEAK